MQNNLQRLRRELSARRVAFRPSVWISTEWFSPDGVAGFAVPFYLMHPRLFRLEQLLMGEVEGHPRAQCQRLLRHETGHAIDTAYRLHTRRDYRTVFGDTKVPYRKTYFAKPTSLHYVRNLPFWYAQSHPSEDFAETFAVWLDPASRWRDRYRGWPALEKLQYMNELMSEIRAEEPRVSLHQPVEVIDQLRGTLGGHYRNRQRRYHGMGRGLDRGLLLAFPREAARARADAHEVLGKHRALLLDAAVRSTVFDRYSLKQALGLLRQRAEQLLLKSPSQLRQRHYAPLVKAMAGYLRGVESRRSELLR